MSPSQSPGSNTGWTCSTEQVSAKVSIPRRARSRGGGSAHPAESDPHPQCAIITRSTAIPVQTKGSLCGRAAPHGPASRRGHPQLRYRPSPRGLSPGPLLGAVSAVPSPAGGTELCRGYRVLPAVPSPAVPLPSHRGCRSAAPQRGGWGGGRARGTVYICVLYPWFISTVHIRGLYPRFIHTVYIRGSQRGHSAARSPAGRRQPRSSAPHHSSPHRTAPLRSAPHHSAPHHSAPHRTASLCSAPHHSAQHYITLLRTIPLLTAPLCSAPHRTASHRITSLRSPAQRRALPLARPPFRARCSAERRQKAAAGPGQGCGSGTAAVAAVSPGITGAGAARHRCEPAAAAALRGRGE